MFGGNKICIKDMQILIILFIHANNAIQISAFNITNWESLLLVKYLRTLDKEI